jgi:hypothetical protein
MSGTSVDLYEAIRRLYAQKESLMRAIAALEALQNGGGTTVPAEVTRSTRGRKSMNSDERRQVSVRMKKYWASRRVASMEEGRR